MSGHFSTSLWMTWRWNYIITRGVSNCWMPMFFVMVWWYSLKRVVWDGKGDDNDSGYFNSRSCQTCKVEESREPLVWHRACWEVKFYVCSAIVFVEKICLYSTDSPYVAVFLCNIIKRFFSSVSFRRRVINYYLWAMMMINCALTCALCFIVYFSY
jgi:hypothetical protein